MGFIGTRAIQRIQVVFQFKQISGRAGFGLGNFRIAALQYRVGLRAKFMPKLIGERKSEGCNHLILVFGRNSGQAHGRHPALEYISAIESQWIERVFEI